jgi:hypothetical protein
VLEKIGTDDAKKALEPYLKQQQDIQINALITHMKKSSPPLDIVSVEALVKIGRPSVAPVTPLLKDPKPTVRLGAAKVLNQLGVASASATSALIEALDDSEKDVRQEAASALGKINSPDAKSAIRFFPLKEIYLQLKEIL